MPTLRICTVDPRGHIYSYREVWSFRYAVVKGLTPTLWEAHKLLSSQCNWIEDHLLIILATSSQKKASSRILQVANLVQRLKPQRSDVNPHSAVLRAYWVTLGQSVSHLNLPNKVVRVKWRRPICATLNFLIRIKVE